MIRILLYVFSSAPAGRNHWNMQIYLLQNNYEFRRQKHTNGKIFGKFMKCFMSYWLWFGGFRGRAAAPTMMFVHILIHSTIRLKRKTFSSRLTFSIHSEWTTEKLSLIGRKIPKLCKYLLKKSNNPFDLNKSRVGDGKRFCVGLLDAENSLKIIRQN